MRCKNSLGRSLLFTLRISTYLCSTQLARSFSVLSVINRSGKIAMNLFDNKPHMFRLAFGILLLYLLGIGLYNFFRYTSTPTDENLFRNPRTALYFTESMSISGPAPSVDNSTTLSLQVGDMLYMVNKRNVRDLEDLRGELSHIHNDSILHLTLVRLSKNESFTTEVRKSSFPLEFFRELQPTALVVDVTRDGASDRAGMRVGDIIMRINGQSFKDANNADLVLRRAQIGKSIEYEVLRNNEAITLHVTLASFGIQIYFLSLFLAGIMFMAMGTFVGMNRPQHIASRLMGLFFVLAGFALVVGPIQRDAQQDWFVLIRNVSFVLGIFLAFATSHHLHHYFPTNRPELISRPWLRRSGYILALVAAVAVFVFHGGVFFLGLSSLIAYSVGAPLFYRKQCPPEYRKLARPTRWAGIITGIVAGFFAFLVFLSGGVRIQLLAFIGIVLLLIPLSYLYTIARYRLLDMNLRIRRNIQYSFVSVAWTVLSFIVLLWTLTLLLRADFGLPDIRLTGASIEVIDSPMPVQERAIWEKGVAVMLALVLTFSLRGAGRAGQKFIAKKFYRSQYDYRRAASELATVMATTLSMNELARGIVEKLTDLMQLKRVGVMFFREKVACCQEADGFDGSSWTSFCLSVEKDIVQTLQQFKSEVSVDYLPPDMKAGFRHNEIQYIIPIRSKERLIGALLIGEKRSESTFQAEDLEFLAAVAKQASVAIENAFLYEELAEQERMKHELAIARRIQLESLPQTTPQVDGLDIAGVSVPAMEVGGDYFDYLNGDVSKLTVIVGDVSGKGTSAALYMSKVQGILRSLHGFGLSPRDFFVRANALLCNDMEKRSFVTAMGGFFDPKGKRLVLARAGHLPLFHYRARSATVDQVIPKGLGLGLNSEGVFASELEERTIQYEQGDVFLFVTDGITEAQQRNGNQFGEERLIDTLRSSSALSVMEIRDRILSDVKTFAGDAVQHDDQTVVVVKVT